MHAELAQTHEERIQWLYYENIVILTEYLSAKLLYDIAKVRFQEKGYGVSLREYKIRREAFTLWKEVNENAKEHRQKYLQALKVYLKYHVAGVSEEWELEEE